MPRRRITEVDLTTGVDLCEPGSTSSLIIPPARHARASVKSRSYGARFMAATRWCSYSAVSSFSSWLFPCVPSGLPFMKSGGENWLEGFARTGSVVSPSSLSSRPNSLPAFQFFVSSSEFSPASTPCLNSAELASTFFSSSPITGPLLRQTSPPRHDRFPREECSPQGRAPSLLIAFSFRQNAPLLLLPNLRHAFQGRLIPFEILSHKIRRRLRQKKSGFLPGVVVGHGHLEQPYGAVIYDGRHLAQH